MAHKTGSYRSIVISSTKILQTLFQHPDFVKLNVSKDQKNWSKVGIDLGLPLEILNTIWKKAEHQSFMYNAIGEIIVEWINLKGSRALVSDLINVMNRNDLCVFAGSLASLVDYQIDSNASLLLTPPPNRHQSNYDSCRVMNWITKFGNAATNVTFEGHDKVETRSKRDSDVKKVGRDSDVKRLKRYKGGVVDSLWDKQLPYYERKDKYLTCVQLQKAIKKTDKRAVIEILKRSRSDIVNARTRDFFKNTPLILASRFIRNKEESINIIKILMENGADPSIRDCYYRTFIDAFISPPRKSNFPLLSKISSQQFNRIVKILIKTGNIQYLMLPNWEGNGMYILQSVIEHIEVSRETIQLLHFNKIDFNKLTDKGDGVLYYALLGNRSIQMIKDLIEVGKADWKHVNNGNGWNFLHYAAKFNNIDAFEFFLNLDPREALRFAQSKNINNHLPLDIFHYSEGRLNYDRANTMINFVRDKILLDKKSL